MSCRHTDLPNAHHLVGDPIDAVTGVNVSAERDLFLDGPLPLRWTRHYDSSQNARMFPLGWGQTHRYDWRLKVDVDGFRLEGPVGRVIGFPPLTSDGEEAAQQGLLLERTAELRYRVYQPDQPAMTFQFTGLLRPAPLQELTFGSFSIGFHYDQNGFLTHIIDSLQRRIDVTYDVEGRITQLILAREVKDKSRLLLTYRYDPAGRLIEGIDAYGKTFSFEYDADNRMVKQTDRRGYSFHFEYDSSGRCTRSAGQDGLLETRLRFLPGGIATTVTKADGGEWLYVCEAGALAKIVDPYGGVETFTTDTEGRTFKQTDPNGNALQMVYDDETGALLGVRDWFGRFRAEGKERFSDLYNRQYTPSAPFSREFGSDWAFDSFRPPAVVNARLAELPDFVTRLIEKAPLPQPQSPRSTDWRPPYKPMGPGEYEYDLFGNLLRHTDPGGATERWLYDANGNVIRHTDPEGSVWASDFTSWNLLTKQTSPLSDLTQYEYTRSEKVTRVIDPGRTVTELNYDLKERLETRSRHGVVKEKQQYDLADNLIEQRDGRGEIIFTVRVGPGNVPASVEIPNGEKRDFKHDEFGRLIEAVNDAGQLQRNFDEWGNVVSDTRDGLGVEHHFHGFNLRETVALGRFRTIFEEEKDGTRVFTDPAGGKHQLRCLGNGIFLRSLANGTKELGQYDWEGRCRLKAAFSSASQNVLWSRQYSYSPAGNLLQARDTDSGSAQYQYDAAHRLRSEVRQNRDEQVYEHDAAGNLLKAPGLDGVSVDENRLRTANGSQFVYNQRNHIAERVGSDKAAQYEYDPHGQLIRCRLPEGEWTARYDALGRRVSKTWLGKTTVYHWDRERLIAEVFPEGRVRVYCYSHSQARVPFLFIEYDSVDADIQTGRRYYIFTNQIGCPVRIVDDSGQAVWRATLEAYGRAVVERNSSIAFHLRFPGHYLDEETGLHYNRYRYYSPELGRYLQSDPIDINGGINVYAYTRCPLVEVDMDGRGCPLGPLTEEEAQELEEKIAAAKLLAANLRELMQDEETGRFRPLPLIDKETGKQAVDANGKKQWDGPDPNKPITAHDNVTLTVNVIRDQNGDLKTVVTSSSGPGGVPSSVKDELNSSGVPLVSPKPRPAGTVPDEGDTGNHAEQKGDRYAKQQDGQLESTTPTRPCCPGCTKALQNRDGNNSDPNLNVVNPIDGMNKTTNG
jgi:RHS repeat-associated protein